MAQNQNHTSSVFLQNQYDLLRMEYEYEKQSFESQSKINGIDKQVRKGKCWYPVQFGKNYYNSLNQLILEIENCSSVQSEESDFEPGRAVSFFAGIMGGQMKYANIIGQISHIDGNRMYIAVPSVEIIQRLQQISDPGVQLYFDETSYKEMFSAHLQVMQAKNNRLAELREILLGQEPATFRDVYPTRLPWLNASQEQAVNSVLSAKDVAIVHGPPGTGKTTTLVESIHETLHREAQVLVCAQSNTATDWIAEKLAERGIPVLRIGNPLRVSDNMLSCTYENRFASHPEYPELWSIRKTIREMQRRSRKGSAEKDTLYNQIQKLKSRATELEIRIDNAIFSSVRVVASTLIGASNKVLSGKHFTTLFIDEAAQALDAACWNAIRKANRVVLAGDHCQLPPTIKCIEAARNGLDRTLMEKIVTEKPMCVTLLTTQYRMDPAIMAFSSEWFYKGALKAAPEIGARSGFLMEYPLMWYDTALCGNEEETNENTLSRLNRAEAHQLIELLETYIRKIGENKIKEERIDFGIISPYKSQVYYIRGLIKRNSILRKFKKQITVNTVDGFQGQERDFILLSMVRGNESGRIGFLSDLRRMNVAITRARYKLIILGDANTLTSHPFYKKLYEHIDQHGAIQQIEPTPTV